MDDAVAIRRLQKKTQRVTDDAKPYASAHRTRNWDSTANYFRTLRRAKVFQDDLELVEGGALAVALPHHGAQLFEISRESHLRRGVAWRGVCAANKA